MKKLVPFQVKLYSEELLKISEKIPRLREALKTAVEYGDLSENAEFEIAKQSLDVAERSKAVIEEVLKNHEVVETVKSDFIEVGDTIVVKFSENEEYQMILVHEYYIPLTSIEQLMQMLTVSSPIGSAIHGKKPGKFRFQVETIFREVEVRKVDV